jgi:4-hydroxy-tetrahydrodipicolinate synthase
LDLHRRGGEGREGTRARTADRGASGAAALAGDFAAARKVHERIFPLMTGNFIESNPIPAKAAMKMLDNFSTDTVRSPLAPLAEASRKRMAEILAECGLA